MRDIHTRFMDKVSIDTDTKCWNWTGAKAGAKHGYFRPYGRKGPIMKAHRVAYVLFSGYELPPNVTIRHTCKNPGCVNPSHLVIRGKGLQGLCVGNPLFDFLFFVFC